MISLPLPPSPSFPLFIIIFIIIFFFFFLFPPSSLRPQSRTLPPHPFLEEGNTRSLSSLACLPSGSPPRQRRQVSTSRRLLWDPAQRQESLALAEAQDTFPSLCGRLAGTTMLFKGGRLMEPLGDAVTGSRTAVPLELLGLDSLHDVLNVDVWERLLSPQQREELLVCVLVCSPLPALFVCFLRAEHARGLTCSPFWIRL